MRRACGLGGRELSSCITGPHPVFIHEAVGAAVDTKAWQRMKLLLRREPSSWRRVRSAVSPVATTSGRPLGDGESFVVEGGEGSRTVLGLVPAPDGEVAGRIFWPGFHVPSVKMRAKLSPVGSRWGGCRCASMSPVLLYNIFTQ